MGLKNLLAVFPMCERPVERERRIVQVHRCTVMQLHVREREIRVGEDGEDVCGGLRHQSGLGNDLLLGFRARVFPAPQSIVQRVTVDGKAWFRLEKRFHRLPSHAENLRFDKRRACADVRPDLTDLLLVTEKCGIPGVDVGMGLGIGVQAGEGLADGTAQVQTGQKVRRRVCECPAKGVNPRDVCQQLVLCGFPCIKIGIHRTEVPGILRGDLAAVPFCAQ